MKPPLRLYSSLGFEGWHGWGVLTRELHRELAKRCDLHVIPPDAKGMAGQRVEGHVLLATVGNFQTLCPLRGTYTHGLGLFDHPLAPDAGARAREFDLVFTGSQWCARHLREAGIAQAVPFAQGVDTALFRPDAAVPSNKAFVVFSGGKLEWRKGQDLVIAALRILQERHPDIVLMTLWTNYLGEASVRTLAASPHIRFEWTEGQSDPAGRDLCLLNGLDPARVLCAGPVVQEALPDFYRNCDLGLFPNRCEAATNLVMCEFMACGRPVAASSHFGHADVVAREHAFLLEPRRHLGTLDAEPSVEEIVETVEFAYHHRELLPVLGQRARRAMEEFTWGRAAETLLDAMRRVEEQKAG